MNELGQIAMTHWERWRPEELRQIPNPREHFTQVGMRAQEQVVQLTEEILRREPPKEDYLAEVSRRSTAEATARELVLSDLLVMPQGQPSESSPSTDLIDPSGMPTDQSHPLWGDLEDDRVSPSEFQKRRAAWMQSLQTL
ncbi:hypothetical protein [Janibacter sp. GXQ6167]|uniref:hypothetical protein n=1 Tax=Janibacter sp. GXQ6167 TaxID=3240791 RepID=UPI0035236F27